MSLEQETLKEIIQGSSGMEIHNESFKVFK